MGLVYRKVASPDKERAVPVREPIGIEHKIRCFSVTKEPVSAKSRTGKDIMVTEGNRTAPQSRIARSSAACHQHSGTLFRISFDTKKKQVNADPAATCSSSSSERDSPAKYAFSFARSLPASSGLLLLS